MRLVCLSGSSVHRAAALALSWERNRLNCLRLLLSASLSVHYSTELQTFVCDMVEVAMGRGGTLRGVPKAVCMKVTLWMLFIYNSFTVSAQQFFTTVICCLRYYRYWATNTLKTSITLSLQLAQKTKLPHVDFVGGPIFLFFLFITIFGQSALGNGSPVVIVFVSYE